MQPTLHKHITHYFVHFTEDFRKKSGFTDYYLKTEND